MLPRRAGATAVVRRCPSSWAPTGRASRCCRPASRSRRPRNPRRCGGSRSLRRPRRRCGRPPRHRRRSPSPHARRPDHRRSSWGPCCCRTRRPSTWARPGRPVRGRSSRGRARGRQPRDRRCGVGRSATAESPASSPSSPCADLSKRVVMRATRAGRPAPPELWHVVLDQGAQPLMWTSTFSVSRAEMGAMGFPLLSVHGPVVTVPSVSATVVARPSSSPEPSRARTVT